MRYRSKRELIDDISSEHGSLVTMLEEVPEALWNEPGVWGDGWTVADLVAHLTEWHRLFLGWFDEGRNGGTPAMPAPGFKWNETPRLNRAIQAKHRDRPLPEIRREFEGTHREVLDLARHVPEADLLESGRFPWTGKNALVTYLGANTASHYRFAQKVLKRWSRSRGGDDPGAGAP